MKLYVDESPTTCVWRIENKLKVKVGMHPLGVVFQLALLFCASLMFMILFLLLSLRLLWGYMSGMGQDAGWAGWLFIIAFLLAGTTFSAFCALYLMNIILPFSAEVDIASKTMCFGNRLWRLTRQFSDDVLLIVEPCYTRGDWGFKMQMSSQGKKSLLLPCMYVGSYSNAISKARCLAKKIHECAPFVRIEESKYWRIH